MPDKHFHCFITNVDTNSLLAKDCASELSYTFIHIQKPAFYHFSDKKLALFLLFFCKSVDLANEISEIFFYIHVLNTIGFV